MQETTIRLKKMADITIREIKSIIPSSMINGDTDNRLPGTINISFEGVSGESFMNILDLKGIFVSTSSACNSGKDIPSHVLLALGLSKEQAKSAIRISYGKYNTFDEVKYVAATICEVYSKIKTAM